MTLSIADVHGLDVSPIDLVEDLAALKRWEVDRLSDDQIAMVADGVWRSYKVSLAWCDFDETLRMVCTFELEARDESLAELYKAIECANQDIWIGGFNYWREQELIAYRYGLTLSGRAGATSEQVDAMLKHAFENCERYFPAFHLVGVDLQPTKEAFDAALLQAAGQA